MPTNNYTSQPTPSAYNQSPPSDDNSETESNRGKWSTIKTKIGDALVTFCGNINSQAVTAFGKTINNNDDDNYAMGGSLAFTSSELTIDTGSVTATRSHHTIDTEADAATDDLDTIVVGSVSDGTNLVIRAAHTDRTVVVKHNTGNIQLANGLDLSLDDDLMSLAFQRRGTDWHETARSLRPVWDELASGTASAVSTLDILFTASKWRVVKVFLTDYLPSTDSALWMRTSTDGGSTFDSGATDYGYTELEITITPGSGANASTGNSEIIVGLGSVGAVANEGAQLEVDILDPATANHKTILWRGDYYNGTSNNIRHIAGQARRFAAADVDGLRFLPSGGTLTARYKVIGLKE